MDVGGIARVVRHDGGLPLVQDEAVLGRRKELERETARGVGRSRRSPEDVLPARNRLDAQACDRTTLLVDDSAFDDRTRIGFQRIRGRCGAWRRDAREGGEDDR